VDDGIDPIADEELLYRRIPVSMNWYSDRGLSDQAFAPRKDDKTGISVSRAEYTSIEDAAKGSSKQGYYVAVLRAGDLRGNGIEVVPRRLPDDPSHCELPDLNYANRKDERTQELQRILVASCRRVEGPFLTPK